MKFEPYEKKIIWIGKTINDTENSYYQKVLKDKGYNLYTYTEIDDGLEKLKKIKFELTYLIITGSYFNDFSYKLTNIKDNLFVCPNIIIFTHTYRKNMLLNSDDYYRRFIYNDFYDKGGFAVIFSEVESFLEEDLCYISPHEVTVLKKEIGDFTFQTVSCKEDLIAPVFLSELIKSPTPQQKNEFDQFLIKNYGNSNIYKLISQIYDKDCPLSIRIKYWLRAYTIESNFYKNLNTQLMQNNYKDYLPYIQILYEGIESNNLNFNFIGNLYRGSLISNLELNNLKSYQKNKKNNLPFALVFCKNFLSFSKNRNKAESFMGYANNSLKKVLYIIEKGNYWEDSKNASNADLTEISYFSSEEEILFFPFSIFEVEKIEENNQYYVINLKYLGKYKDLFKNDSKEKLFDSIPYSEFTNQLKNSGLSKIKNLNNNKIYKAQNPFIYQPELSAIEYAFIHTKKQLKSNKTDFEKLKDIFMYKKKIMQNNSNILNVIELLKELYSYLKNNNPLFYERGPYLKCKKELEELFYYLKKYHVPQTKGNDFKGFYSFYFQKPIMIQLQNNIDKYLEELEELNEIISKIQSYIDNQKDKI